MRRPSLLSRLLLALAAFCVLCAGPVAACICTVDSAHAMPCCPDQQGSGQPPACPQPDSQAAAVCDPVSADALANASFDLSVPPAIFVAALPVWSTHDPPRSPIPVRRRLPDPPPLYLTTLRLRN